MERMTGEPVEKWDDIRGTTTPSDITNEMTNGERFMEIRAMTGMNRKEFAEYLGIPYRTMSDWENDLRTMPGYVMALIEYKVRAEFGQKLPIELDPNELGNVRRGLEDQIEQNDNQLDGIINNQISEEPPAQSRNIIDDNANGIPDEDEKALEEAARPEKKESLLAQLLEFKAEARNTPHNATPLHSKEHEVERCL